MPRPHIVAASGLHEQTFPRFQDEVKVRNSEFLNALTRRSTRFYLGRTEYLKKDTTSFYPKMVFSHLASRYPCFAGCRSICDRCIMSCASTVDGDKGAYNGDNIIKLGRIAQILSRRKVEYDGPPCIRR